MSPRTLPEQLDKYLADAHAIEQQALVQMRTAPKLGGDPAISEAFTRHLGETEEHERMIRGCLESRGARPAPIKDAVAGLIGRGMAAFAAVQPDTPGKLVAHAYSYEHMEAAAYQLVGLLAERLSEGAVLEAVRRIEGQEREMAGRLEALFDPAVDASLRAVRSHEASAQLNKYLADAHALEEQAAELLRRGPKLAGAPELAAAYQEHLHETIGHRQMVEARLQARGAKPNKLKDAALRLGALNWGAFFAAQPDTPAKLCAFAYAFEHLEIAGYELLRRVAERAGDGETVRLADRLLDQERAAAERLSSLFGEALDASLRDLRLPAR
jgi:ferritin-like metal-binding protein YciE